MNWVLILVILIVAVGAGIGYKRGMLRIAYSMVSWIIVLACVSWVTPHISRYLMDNTAIYNIIEQHCESAIRDSVTAKTTELAEEKSEEQQKGIASQSGVASQSELMALGMNIPDAVLENIFDDTVEMAGDLIEQSGIYEEIASGLANFVLDGIAIFCALIFTRLVVTIISQLLGVVSHIPVIRGMNRTLGLFAGGIYGLMIVWILFYIVALCNAGDVGKVVVPYIYENPVLTFLYENNLVLTLILKYL